MLRSVGIDCLLPNEALKRELRSIGCDTVLDIESLVKGWGYESPMPLPLASSADMSRTDVIYFDVKAHRNGPLVTKRWPNLAGKVCWYRINGGKPEHVIKPSGEDCGDEINPGCPILTPNLWYRDKMCGNPDPTQGHYNCAGVYTPPPIYAPWRASAYACWPPFHRFNEYSVLRHAPFEAPICLIHNLHGWGYGALIPSIRALGVKCHGVSSPDGLVQHREIPKLLSRAVATVHLKSSDAPGYALYESLAAGCPVICSRRLIWRNRMEDLFIPGETCLVFDRETHDALSPEEVVSCAAEIEGHLEALKEPGYNQAIGQAGRARLLELMWSKDRSADVASLSKFMERFR